MINTMIILLTVTFFMEFSIILLHKKNKFVSFGCGATAIVSTFTAGSIFALKPSLASFILIPLSLVRMINLLRFVEYRMHPDELTKRSKRTFIFELLITTLVLSYAVLFDDKFSISLGCVILIQFAVAFALFLSVFITKNIYKPKIINDNLDNLPTVSVCIPARNETQDLPECIESVLACNYPKLEIIVLDDCSHDKTPDIIKRYAHDGVRFINGKEPRSDWLAKNAAYDRLADEATGEILVFVGVDIRLDKNSVLNIVTQLNGSDMISFMPERAEKSETSIFIQPIRYWWELGLWRFSLNKPPVLSSCWAIRAKSLNEIGTFESVKKAIDPEAVLARKFVKNKLYKFIISERNMGIHSKKTPKAQYQTALRKRYPQLKRRPENIALLLFFETIFLFLPYLIFIWFSFNGSFGSLYYLNLATIIFISSANASVYTLTLKDLWLLGLVSMPTLVIADWLLALRSLYAYEYGKVVWKERNICLPLLTVEKALPKF